MLGGMTGEWWREFFDDDYALLYGATLTPERTEAEVAGVAALLALPEGARLLDLCCGDGRHAVALHRRGFRVVGVDASAPLLARARRRAASVLGGNAPESDAPDLPSFVRADARALPLRQAFNAATLLFTSIGYGSDDDSLAMLRAARAALVPGGQLVVECAHRDDLVRRRGDAERETETLDVGGVRVTTERRFDALLGVEHATFTFARPGGEAPVEKRFRHRVFTPGELLALLRVAGFTRLDVYGDYDRRAFTASAPRLLVHARQERCDVEAQRAGSAP